MVENQHYYFNISILSHSVICDKRFKLESFYGLSKVPSNGQGHNAIKTGNRLHHEYSYFKTDFDRERVKQGLKKYLIKSSRGHDVYSKTFKNITISGIFDDLQVIMDKGIKKTVLIELKTTSKQYMWSREVQAAIKQLELYMWLLKDNLEELEFPLADYGLVKIYSQRTGLLIKRYNVSYNNDIEEWISHVVNKVNGLEKVEIPAYEYCKHCPSHIVKACDWNRMRKEVHY
jgi:hypothetical protein